MKPTFPDSRVQKGHGLPVERVSSAIARYPLLGSLRDCLDRFPDKRRGGNTTYPMGDIGMAVFSVFFLQSPSFLAHQRQFEAGHGHSNGTSLFGLAKISSDNHVRDMLDPASPDLLHPVFAAALDQLRQIDRGLDVFRRLDGRVLIALDAPSIMARARSIAGTARPGSEARARSNITTACWPPRWWRPGTTRSSRWSRHSSPRRTGRRSRIARPR